MNIIKLEISIVYFLTKYCGIHPSNAYIQAKALKFLSKTYPELRFRKLIRRINFRLRRLLTMFITQERKPRRDFAETIYIDGIPSNSLSQQDLFALKSTNFKFGGTYLEIGAGWFKKINNTFVLEKFFDWSGISIDFDPVLVEDFNRNRRNQCLYANALHVDYLEICDLFERKIDYLSLDIDPAHQTLHVLFLLPFDEVTFQHVTFEHDSYLNGVTIKFLARMWMKAHGYRIVSKDVRATGYGKYEDWFSIVSK